MKLFKKFLAATLLICLTVNANGAKQGPVIWNIQHLKNVKSGIKANMPIYNEAYKMLIDSANADLLKPNPTVMDKPKAPASGDKHDYTSLSRYYWPNPNSPDGLPYISRDGESNPELNSYDRNRLGNMCNSVANLSLAYYLSGNKAYATKAVSILNTWFINPLTKMNPNLNYSQMVPGLFEGKGRPAGLIDSYSFITLVDAVTLLNSSKMIPGKDYKQIKSWFAQLTQWMLTAENGIKEGEGSNNHAVAYDAQVAMYAHFAGNDSLTEKIVKAFPTKRLATQIQPDGSQPRELTRTIAFHYSVYNIVHIMDMCDIASRIGVKLYHTENGAIDRAFGWLIPYLGKPETFPYKQINDWRTVEKSLAQQIYRASAYSKDERYPNIYNKFKGVPEDYMFTLLYVK
ncbi:MAG TPA: alginate lyase family protein [Bacteroidales bacterium]|nr:alginate lyase family protein [Bacteroidales bacterium]